MATNVDGLKRSRKDWEREDLERETAILKKHCSPPGLQGVRKRLTLDIETDIFCKLAAEWVDAGCPGEDNPTHLYEDESVEGAW